MTILTEKAMLVYHTTKGKSFGKTKRDKALSAENERTHGAKKGSVKSNKVLIHEGYTEKLSLIGRESYEYHIANTLPWDRAGGMILPSQHYFTYTGVQRAHSDNYQEAAAAFEAVYDEAVEEAMDRLGGPKEKGGLFNPADFPKKDKLFLKNPETGRYMRFNITVDIEPISDVADFRVDLNQMEIGKLQKQLEDRMQKVLTNAVGTLWSRLKAPIEILRDRLAAYDEADRKLMLNAWIDNVSDIVKLIPQLNLTGDPELDRICAEAEARLCRWNAEQIKVSKPTRDFVASAADEILTQMAGYCGVMGMQDAA